MTDFCSLCQRDVPEETIHHCKKTKETIHPAANVDAATWTCPHCGESL